MLIILGGSRSSNKSGYKVRRWTDHNHAQILEPIGSTRLNSHPIIDFVIICNFPFSHTIQTVNDLSSDQLLVVLRFKVNDFQLDTTQAFFANWRILVYVIENMDTPPSEIQSAED